MSQEESRVFYNGHVLGEVIKRHNPQLEMIGYVFDFCGTLIYDRLYKTVAEAETAMIDYARNWLGGKT